MLNSLKQLATNALQEPKTIAAAATSVATAGTGAATQLAWLPANIGWIASLIGAVATIILVVIQIRKHRLEYQLLENRVKMQERELQEA